MSTTSRFFSVYRDAKADALVPTRFTRNFTKIHSAQLCIEAQSLIQIRLCEDIPRQTFSVRGSISERRLCQPELVLESIASEVDSGSPPNRASLGSVGNLAAGNLRSPGPFRALAVIFLRWVRP